MREFLIRRLRRAPVVRPLWNEFERIQDERDAAVAERDQALRERDSARIERDRVLASDTGGFIGRYEVVRDFGAPTGLETTATPLRRVLLIGSCFGEELVRYIEQCEPRCAVDLIALNFVAALPDEPPRPMSDYDFQIILLPLRVIMPERHHMRLDYADLSSYEVFFEGAVSRLRALLDTTLKYAHRFGKLTFIVNLLRPQQNPMGRLLPKSDLRNAAYFCARLNAELEMAVGSLRDVHIVDADGLAAGIGRRWVQDDSLWSFSHGAPITDWNTPQDQDRLEPTSSIARQMPLLVDQFMAALWREIIAMYRTLRQIDPVKLVVIDLDDTLWRGVAADLPAIDAQMIEGWTLGFIEALHYAKKRGVLLAIISKNEPQLVDQLWPEICGGRIELADFVVAKINWRSKVENMEELLGEVNLLPRNVLFIDDNPVERSAMQTAFPDMRVIGDDPYMHRRLVLWAPEMQVPIVTKESAERSDMVRAQVRREHASRRLSREEFLSSLDLSVHLTRVQGPGDFRFPRAFELLNKTNQFNTTGRRWTTEEIIHGLATGTEIYAFDVADTYTKYGLVGVVIVSGTTVEQFVMSCRVVGLDVELAVVAVLGRRLGGLPVRRIRAVVRETGVNLLARDLWPRCGFTAVLDGWEALASDLVDVPPHIEVVSKPDVAAVA